MVFFRSFGFSAMPRVVAVAASGAIHATVFASLAFATPRTGARAVETIDTVLLLETREDVSAPPAIPPPIPRNTTRLSAPHEAHEAASLLERPKGAPDFLARFMMAIPSPRAPDPAARDEGELRANSDGERASDNDSDSDGTTAGPLPETTYGEDDVATPAKLLSNVNATYPTQAWSSGVEADVPVEIVVDARGSVASARVVTRAGHGFDEAALASVRSYQFAAAQRDGHAVRVRVRWSIQFRLHR